MNSTRIKLSIFINYFVFAILLNSVGTVILQVQRNYGVTESAASVLEGFKDLSIAITSFAVMSFLTRIGYRRAMLLALGFITAVCTLMPSLPGFAMTKALFAATGISFALIKVSAFATIGLVTQGSKEHASFMSFLESFFMIGILCGYFLFGAFANDGDPTSTAWLKVSYFLAGVAALAFILLLVSPIDESAIEKNKQSPFAANMAATLRIAASPLVIIFVASVFIYVLIEQGIMSWLPTFNNHVLELPATLSIQMASILAGATALGRFLSGFALRRFAWLPVLSICLLAAAVLVLVAMPLAGQNREGTITGWLDAPLAAWIFPLIGLFIAPVYPTINSTILSALPTERHAPMSSLIVIFSALGGTTGSLITGSVFEAFGGRTAFYGSLIPLAMLLALLIAFNRHLTRSHSDGIEPSPANV